MVGRIGGFDISHLVYRLETSDTTPTITGLSYQPSGTSLVVTVGGAQYSATVGSDHTWSITSSSLSSGYYDVWVTKASTDTIIQPNGIDGFRQPDGTSLFLLPGDTSVLFEDVLYVLHDYWAFHDGESGLDTQVWNY